MTMRATDCYMVLLLLYLQWYYLPALSRDIIFAHRQYYPFVKQMSIFAAQQIIIYRLSLMVCVYKNKKLHTK
ncbi:hypothetical protein PGAG_00376 [Phaeocystis globosa virus 12T]|nr:hypothetical protein PGAG_00376 [Phaeocystis globosa virus 12T]